MIVWFRLLPKRRSGPEKYRPSDSGSSMKFDTIRPSAAIMVTSSMPATSPTCWTMKSPSGWKIGKNSSSGDPAAISVRTGTMSVSPLLTAVNPVTVPPPASNASANAWARPWVYGSPSWMAAAVVTPSTSRANPAAAAPWNRSLWAVR